MEPTTYQLSTTLISLVPNNTFTSEDNFHNVALPSCISSLFTNFLLPLVRCFCYLKMQVCSLLLLYRLPVTSITFLPGSFWSSNRILFSISTLTRIKYHTLLPIRNWISYKLTVMAEQCSWEQKLITFQAAMRHISSVLNCWSALPVPWLFTHPLACNNPLSLCFSTFFSFHTTIMKSKLVIPPSFHLNTFKQV
jgi:hypothetical protein